jgi:hypothetical protein
MRYFNHHNNVTNLIHFHFHNPLLGLNPLHISGVKRPSSGGTTLAVFGVSCVHFQLLAHNLQQANSYNCTQLTPKPAGVMPPETGRLTPETCRGLKQNKRL